MRLQSGNNDCQNWVAKFFFLGLNAFAEEYEKLLRSSDPRPVFETREFKIAIRNFLEQSLGSVQD
jgi:hypothetical protein